MRRASWIVAMVLVVAACGGGDTSGVDDRRGDATSPEASTTTTAAPGGGNSGGGSSVPEETSQPGDTTETSQPDNGTTPPGGGSDANDELITSPPPDLSDMTPTNEPPGFNWILLRAFATATAGGGTVEFIGADPIWFTEFNPAGQVVATSGTVTGCTVFESSDGGYSAQASFHHVTERNLHSNFSMSDNGDGTVTWGLYNAESGEEWSATGPGEASIRYFRFESTEPTEWSRFGFDPDALQSYILIDFEGEASENFTTEKSQASSRVLCHYIERP